MFLYSFASVIRNHNSNSFEVPFTNPKGLARHGRRVLCCSLSKLCLELSWEKVYNIHFNNTVRERHSLSNKYLKVTILDLTKKNVPLVQHLTSQTWCNEGLNYGNYIRVYSPVNSRRKVNLSSQNSTFEVYQYI